MQLFYALDNLIFLYPLQYGKLIPLYGVQPAVATKTKNILFRSRQIMILADKIVKLRNIGGLSQEGLAEWFALDYNP